MRKKNWPVHHAEKEILAGLCHYSQADHPILAKAWVVDCHRAVHLLQGGFLEQVELHSREL